MKVLISMLAAILMVSSANKAEAKKAVPLWMRFEHYYEEASWCQICYESEHVSDTDVGEIEPDPDDLEYLAIAIFCEAGANAQSDLTRYRVGDVILTRVADERFPNTLYEVLTQKKAYGMFYWTDVVWPERASYEGNQNAVQRARDIAYRLLSDEEHSDLWGKGYIWQDDHERGKDNVWSDGICFGR